MFSMENMEARLVSTVEYASSQMINSARYDLSLIFLKH